VDDLDISFERPTIEAAQFKTLFGAILALARASGEAETVIVKAELLSVAEAAVSAAPVRAAFLAGTIRLTRDAVALSAAGLAFLAQPAHGAATVRPALFAIAIGFALGVAQEVCTAEAAFGALATRAGTTVRPTLLAVAVGHAAVGADNWGMRATPGLARVFRTLVPVVAFPVVVAACGIWDRIVYATGPRLAGVDGAYIVIFARDSSGLVALPAAVFVQFALEDEAWFISCHAAVFVRNAAAWRHIGHSRVEGVLRCIASLHGYRQVCPIRDVFDKQTST